jgi:naphthoate synthase
MTPQTPVRWSAIGAYSDVLLERSDEGIARITINRPEKRNAFRPRTVQELCDAFTRMRGGCRG